MKEYLLLLPLIYIFHDFEEIIGFGWFFRKNPEVFEKYPRLTNAYRHFTNEGMAIGVYEQLILFFGGLSVLAYYFPCRVLDSIWYGMLLALSAHFVVHIALCVYVGKFIPSLITSLLCLPVGILLLIRTAGFLRFDAVTAISVAATILAMMINMKLDHIMMFALGKKVAA